MPFLLALVSLALAQDPPPQAAPPPVESRIGWKDLPINPRYETDFTAYTVPHKRVRLGLVNMDYGLLDNLSIGTAPALFLLGVGNAHGKVDAIQEEALDVALDATWLGYDATRLAENPTNDTLFISALPITATASWILHRQVSLHFGAQWINVNAYGSFGLEDMGTILADAIGVDMGDELYSALSGAGDLYGGAEVTLTQARLGMDYRVNRRDSFILLLRSYTTLNGRVDLGYTQEQVAAGASVKFSLPVEDAIKGLATLSYQGTFKYFRWRVGIPLNPKGTLPTQWFTQGCEIYLLI